jgi:hypothetical protein
MLPYAWDSFKGLDLSSPRWIFVRALGARLHDQAPLPVDGHVESKLKKALDFYL